MRRRRVFDLFNSLGHGGGLTWLLTLLLLFLLFWGGGVAADC